MGSFPDTLIDPSFLVDFCGPCIELKLGKGGQTFLSFNPGASLPSLATKDRKQFQCLTVVLNNKTGTFFLEFN